MNNELSLIRFSVINFFHLIMTYQPFQPITLKLLNIVKALINSETEKDKERLDKIQWILNNTHEKVNIPLSIIELAVFKNINRALTSDIDIKNKTFNLIKLYQYMSEIQFELTEIVIGIAKKYSVDIPMQIYGATKQQSSIEI